MHQQGVADSHVRPMLEQLEPRLLLTTWGGPEGWLEFPTWSQGGVYDDQVPLDPGGQRSDVGCVATAASQVLYYWNYPTAIPFSPADEYTSEGRNGNIRIDEDAVNNDFPNLATLNSELSVIDYVFATDEMAYLSFGVGVKYKMNYSSDGSVAITSFGGSAFRNDFGFGSADVMKRYAAGGVWAQAEAYVIGNIKSGWPVIAAIYDYNESTGTFEDGHSVIIDGYRDTDDQFHVNLGWGETGDDWYDIPDIYGEWDTVGAIVYNIAPYQGWSQWGGESENAHWSTYGVPHDDIEKWHVSPDEFQLGGYAFAGLVVGQGGNIFVSAGLRDPSGPLDPAVLEVDMFGELVDVYSLPGEDEGITYPAQNELGEIFVGSDSGGFYRIDPASDTVQLLFQDSQGDGISDAVRIDDAGHLYFNTLDTLYSYTRTGVERWRYDVPGQEPYILYGPAAVDGARNHVYLTYYDLDAHSSSLVAIGSGSGTEIWREDWTGLAHSAWSARCPAVGADGSVYVAQGMTLRAFTANGQDKWSRSFDSGISHVPAVTEDGNTVYIGNHDGDGTLRIRALNASGSAVKYEAQLPVPASWDYDVDEVLVGSNDTLVVTVNKSGQPDEWFVFVYQDTGASLTHIWGKSFGANAGATALGPGATLYVLPRGYGQVLTALTEGEVGDPYGAAMGYTNNGRPAVPSNLGPPDGSQELDTTVTLSWACSDPDGHGLFYDIYLGGGTGGQQGEMIPVETSFAGTSVVVDNLAPGESYVWRVIATDGQTITPGPSWTFATDDLFPGDANDDGSVDGLDYIIWSNNYHQSGGWGEGDFTGDGYVDGLDYIVWSNNYDPVVPAIASTGTVGDAVEQEVATTAAVQLPESELVGEAGRGAIPRSFTLPASAAPIGPGVSAGLGGWASHAGGASSESDMGGKEDGRDVPTWPVNRLRAIAPVGVPEEVEPVLLVSAGASGRHSPARGLAALEDDLVDILGLVQLRAPLHP